MTNKIEAHKHFILGENYQWFPNEDFIIHLAEPRCFIRYDRESASTATYEDFHASIADVQWLDGKPSEIEQQETLHHAWNFLRVEQRIVDEFFSSSDNDDDEFFM